MNPFAISNVAAGGVSGSVRFTTASTSTGRVAQMRRNFVTDLARTFKTDARTPTASAIAAKFGFRFGDFVADMQSESENWSPANVLKA